MKPTKIQIYYGVSLLLVTATALFMTFAPFTQQRASGQQQFDAAATVTALVQLRDSIIATLTATALPNGGRTAAQPAATANNASVEIKVRGLNVRAGPGTSYNVITTINAGQRYQILGQHNNCAWLKIGDSSREIGWISGGQQFVTYTTACSALPSAQ